ncbi:ABC transporter substrate-binding protein [Methylobacterium oryzihabitans]|uniref:ABC transporter substrate-binding protein n=2 Tax=Methylobacterium oryzihabitans TaxID=2499852 RepID=A0A437P9R1_9HYPH|nr:ABC transporter substrate-binding protein [Methylobacterium oryzihabitans]RVU19014.1 ABC transporter substrate-binding protein [Methylobacterium oryzihabitans]
MRRRFGPVLAASLWALSWMPAPAQAQGEPVKVGYAKCAHCLPMALLPDFAKGATIDAIGFNSGNDVLTALISKSLDVAQVTYLHYVTALDKGFDVVAVAGEVNGGSECLAAKGLALKADDWAGFKAAVEKAKAAGTPLKVAASRGNAQDIHMRGAFLKHGINPNKDVQFVNIPNPSDHLAAVQRGEIDMVCSVEPFASQIRMAGAATRFVLPYDQAAGNLTNLIVTRSDVIKTRRAAVQAVVDADVALVARLDADKSVWIDVINQKTGLSKEVAAEAIKNAEPDYRMHRAKTLAIAAMMRDLKYIGRDVSAEAEKNMDYSFLEAATKKTRDGLGH